MMIEYVITSYVLMFIWCAIDVVKGESLKSAFKAWVFSPFILPLAVIVLFMRW